MTMGPVTSLPHRFPGITLAVFFISIYFIWVAALSCGVSDEEDGACPEIDSKAMESSWDEEARKEAHWPMLAQHR